MKKYLALLLCLCCLLTMGSLTACDTDDVFDFLGDVVDEATDMIEDMIDDIIGAQEGDKSSADNQTPEDNKEPNNNAPGDHGSGNKNDRGDDNQNAGGATGDGGAGLEDEKSYVESGDLETINGQNPNQLYAAAAAKLTEYAHNYECVAQVYMTMTYEGQTETFTMSSVSRERDGNVYTKISGDEFLVSDLAGEAWYVDGWLYQIRDGKKVKAEMSMQEFMDQYYGAEEGESTLMDIPESWLNDVSFFSTADGGFFRVVLKGEEMLAALERVGIGTGDASISAVTYDVHFDSQGELTHIDTSYTMMMSGIHCDVTGVTTYSNVGNATPITAPQDADSFLVGYIR